MRQITCSFCGAAYDPTQGACPVCGTANAPSQQPRKKEGSPERAPAPQGPDPMEDTILASDLLPKKENTRTPVRQAAAPERRPSQPRKSSPEELPHSPAVERKPQEPAFKEKKPNGRRDKTVCIVLGVVAAILALYIGYRFLRPALADRLSGGQTPPSTTASTVAESIPCQKLTLDAGSIVFTKQGDARLLNVTQEPKDTTDVLAFTSANPAVAKVSNNGRVEAAGQGKTQITVTCGDAQAVCEIVCDFGESTEPSTTAPTESTPPTSEPSGAHTLSSTDFTLFEKGETARLTISGLSNVQVAWTSDDPDIATVDNGKVTAVGPGTTRVRAKFQSQELVCIVRCNFPGETEKPGDENRGSSDSYSLSHTDVTIDVGETFTLRLRDGGGNSVSVTWSVQNSGICSVDGSGTVTGVSSGSTEVSTSYQGSTYTCIIRVR